MKNTKAIKCFKKEFGQLNHFLLTTVIGLNALNVYNITKPPPGLSVSWNPKNLNNSANRSRGFVLKSFLYTIVNSIEMYFNLIENQKPIYIEDKTFTEIFDNRHIFIKTKNIIDYFKISSIESILIKLIIQYRNKIVHYKATNTLEQNDIDELINAKNEIEQKYCNLDINIVLDKFEKVKSPSLKEIASFNHIVHEIIYEIDSNIVAKSNMNNYYEVKALKYLLKTNDKIRKKYFNPEKLNKNMIINVLRTNCSIEESDIKDINKLLSIKKEDIT